MANLLGDLWNEDGSAPSWSEALQDSGISLHLYGKKVAKKGRKMGHLTNTGSSIDDLVDRITAARRRLSS